jgi:hypothetical protein
MNRTPIKLNNLLAPRWKPAPRYLYLVGSTSRGAALCRGAAGLKIYKSMRTEGASSVRMSAHDPSRVIAGLRRCVLQRCVDLSERAILRTPRASRRGEIVNILN